MDKSQSSKKNISQIKNKISLKRLKSDTDIKAKINFRKPSSLIYSDYESLYELYSQRQFKQIVKTIKLKSDQFGKFFLNEWKLLHIRIISLQKILDDKISKYYNNMNKIRHFSNYINDVNNDINNWIILIKELISQNDTKYIGSFIEFIICFILKNCIILSKKYIQFGFIKEAIATLSLSLGLISQTKKYFTSPDSYYLASEILLYFSSLMIAEKIYDTAMNLISLSIKFSYMSFELRLSKNCDNYKTLFDLNKYENEKNVFNKIFFKLSIAFYQLSVCHEYKNNSYNAYLAIQSSNFFAKFTKFNDCNLYQNLITKIETRLLMKNRILLFFEENSKSLEKKENNGKKIIIEKKRITYEERRRQRFDKLEKYLDKLKIKEIDDGIPDLFLNIGDKQTKPKILKITKQLKLLNYMMKDEFKDLIKSMKKIEINKLDNKTINLISKRIINMKNKEHFKLGNKIKQKFIIKKNLEERKNSIIMERNNNKDDKDDKILFNLNQKKNFNHMNKSNTFKSTTAISSTTTINKKAQRVHSAFHGSVNKNNLISYNRNNLSRISNFMNSSKKLNTTNINQSMNSSPSGYISIQENNLSNIITKNKSINRSNSFLIKNGKLNTSKSVNLKSKFNILNKSTTNKYNKKSPSKLNLKYSMPKYVHDKIFLSKIFRRNYSFLENQFNREIDFHKNLLKTKCIQEELIRPKAPNPRELKEKAKTFFYNTFYNEIMNARDKQIIFDKNDKYRKNKINRYENFDSNSSLKLNLSDESCLDTEQIKEINDEYINKMTKNIMQINYNQKKFKEKAKKLKF